MTGFNGTMSHSRLATERQGATPEKRRRPRELRPVTLRAVIDRGPVPGDQTRG